MAKVNLIIGVRMKWWVTPLMKVMPAVGWVIGPFLTDEQVDEIGARLGKFVAEHGLALTVE